MLLFLLLVVIQPNRVVMFKYFFLTVKYGFRVLCMGFSGSAIYSILKNAMAKQIRKQALR